MRRYRGREMDARLADALFGEGSWDWVPTAAGPVPLGVRPGKSPEDGARDAVAELDRMFTEARVADEERARAGRLAGEVDGNVPITLFSAGDLDLLRRLVPRHRAAATAELDRRARLFAR